MVVLQIEHPVPSWDGWKESFETDPIDRKGSGARRYRVYRPVTDSNYVIIDLEFDDVGHAEAALAKLQELWGRVKGRTMTDPQTRILTLEESGEY